MSKSAGPRSSRRLVISSAPLGGVVIQLHAVKGMAESVKTVEHHAAGHAHLDGSFQTVVGGRLIGLCKQQGAKGATPAGAGGRTGVVDGAPLGNIARSA